MIQGAREIQRVHALSAASFRRDYEVARRPVIVTGALEGRAAMQRWSLEYLAEHGDVPVRVRVSKRGERQLYDGDSSVAFEFRTVPLRTAVEYIANPRDEIWYVQHVELPKVPELAADIGPLDYLPRVHRSRSLLWVCGGGTKNPLHWDTNHVLMAQISGSKRFVIFPPRDSPKLASLSHRTIWRSTGLDLSDVDHARFPRFERASPWSGTVRPGEILFIPYRWWHYMDCDETCISVSWWWAPSFVTFAWDTARDRAFGFVQRGLRAITRDALR